MPTFNPKEPDEEVNYGKEHPLKDVLSMLTIVGLSFVVILLALDYSTRFIPYFIGLDTETKLFSSEYLEKFKRSNKSPTKNNEESLQALVNQLWLPFDEDLGIKFSPTILKSEQPNAFMSVGGQLSITSGLLKKITSLNGLGFVVCHELGHFYHRHIIRRMGRSLGISVLFYLVGIGDMKRVANFASQTFTRKDESEADAFAVDCVQKRFGHMAGFDEFFELVLKEESLLEQIPFLSTHPVTTSRIDAIELLSTKKGYSLMGKTAPF
ncbi:MAG: M48 family metallopeptidase, partial [Halobacteriovoraceae bacterium]|nr:M48 family metallopeptidase [Halobacteriovoraceae bacterium]